MIKPDGNCPNCGTFVDLPGGFHGTPSMTPHSHRDCPDCARPLIWFKDAQALPEGWMVDEVEERRRAAQAEDL